MLLALAAFLGVSLVVICTPGPDMALTIRNSLTGGRRAGVATAAGVSCGQLVWTLASAVGLAALLQTSQILLEWLRLLGAGYLIYLGLRSLVAAWRSTEPVDGGVPVRQDGGAAFRHSATRWVINATRELAGMRRYLDDDVVSRVHRTPWRDGMSARTGSDVKITELTSRISSAYITDALRQLSVPFDPETRTSARSAAIRAAFRETGGQRPEGVGGDRPTDVALATSMLQVGVDVGRLGLMVVTGQPKNIAEYIQASSRVGRERDRPGLVVTLFNWSRPRDLAYYESFAHTHATLYRRVEALSVTPYARRCLDRGTAATVVAALRNRHESWSLATAAQDLDLTSDEVSGVIERMLDRAKRAGDDQARSYLREKILALTDRWRTEQNRPNNPIAYRKTRIKGVQYSPLLQPAGEGRWTELTVARSMRETENDINLLLPAAPGIFDTVYDTPPWHRPESRSDPIDEGAGE